MAAGTGVLTVRGLEDMLIDMLRNCTKIPSLKKIHAQIVKLSLSQSNFLVTKMVNICDRNSELEYAVWLFKMVSEPNIFLYNAMIRAFTRKEMYVSAIDLYKGMLRQESIFGNEHTYPFVLRSCGGVMCVKLGRQVHGSVGKCGLIVNNVVENSLLGMYVKCDDLDGARKVFDEMGDRDVVSWNSLISGYIRLSQVRKARQLFEEMPDKSVVSWTTMITGFTKIGCYGDALDVFRRMQMVGNKPDWVCLVAVLPACAQLGALEVGKWIHYYAEKEGLMKKTCLCNALIEMYSKCGSVSEARQLFDKMSERDVISWSTLIVGMANHGRALEALELFEAMMKTNVQPNDITFVGIISACGHAGLVDDGLRYFDMMRLRYNIEPVIEHYGCLIDLLGRTGRLDRAYKLITTMPMEPDSAIWGSLLSSCRTYRNLEIAEIAMEHLIKLEPNDSGNYVLLANIYADLGKWEGVSRLRKLIRSKSMKKAPGCSMIEVDNVVQEFLSGDNSKPFSEDLYWLLNLLSLHNSRVEDDTSLEISNLI